MTSEGGTSGGISVWVWVAMGGAVVLAIILAIALSGGGEDEESAATTSTTTTTAAPTTTEATTTTSTEAPTTTEATTTTTEVVTTTIVAAFLVPETPIVAALAPYSATSPVPTAAEAHWYQSNGLYVVLYRGFDASSGTEICAGNSLGTPGPPWVNVSNSPHIGAADAICVGVPKIADLPSGVYTCGALLYYLTEIPVDGTGTLFGTLELGTADGFTGETSQAATDAASTPEFALNQTAYQLPASGVDAGGLVVCG